MHGASLSFAFSKSLVNSTGLFYARSFATVKNVLWLALPLCAFALIFCNSAYGQARPDTSLNTIVRDSLRERQLAGIAGSDTTTVRDSITTKLPFQPKPKKAALYSAILPGAGQIYNRQAWKAPIVYLGMGASFYFLVQNTNEYRRYRRSYLAVVDSDPSTVNEFEGRYGAPELETLRDTYRRYLDMTVLVTALGYTIQVLDALVYAHLRGFDVSEDISLRLGPVQQPGGVGFGFTARLR
jgi:TM2 domain-containing membrane protein YozV